MSDPSPETTPGIFLEHFDLSEPVGGQECIVYRLIFAAAEEDAAESGWSFRSYSSFAAPGTRQDFIDRKIASFPMLILYRDGTELGRWIISVASPDDIQNWAHKLLGANPS